MSATALSRSKKNYVCGVRRRLSGRPIDESLGTVPYHPNLIQMKWIKSEEHYEAVRTPVK